MVQSASKNRNAEPRWPALLAIVMTCFVYGALPAELSIGPRWLLIVLVCGVEIPAMVMHRRGYYGVNHVLGFIASGLITGFMMWSLTLLVISLPAHRVDPVQMLRSAAVLWTSNVLVFSLWYWRLDAGGPYGRDSKPGHTEGAFLFPQMTWEGRAKNWSPRFIDYLFLSFNTSTALSPTDSPILSRWAKGLVMLQSGISLAIVVLLAARAVNVM